MVRSYPSHRERHGMTNTSEYKVWTGMHRRCRDSSDKDYGGRGIRVCERWGSFVAFYADMGARPTPYHTIDRKNNNGDYTPENCRWATREEQAANSRERALVPLRGATQALVLGSQLRPDVADRLQAALLGLWNQLESPHSRAAYAADWRRFCAWLGSRQVHPLAASAMHVQQYLMWMRDKKLAKATRARALTVLRSTYAALVVGLSDLPGVLLVNPARDVRNFRVGTDPKTPWLAEDELVKLLTAPVANATWENRRDWLVVAALVGLGWRRAEVALLRRDAMIAVPGGFSVRVRAKGGKEAIVPMPSWLTDEIEAWCAAQGISNGFVFPRRPGVELPMTPVAIWLAVKRTAARNDVDPRKATPHALRRSFVTITGQRGVSIEDRQAAMLHASKTTTERYDKAAKLPAAAPGEALRDLVRRK